MAALTAADVQVFALSYDEPAALRDFRDAHNITYTLLADPESTIIRQFGILNTLIAEDDHPWFGIPYPGTYVINPEGLITHKFFENNLAVRVGPEQLLRAVGGAPADVAAPAQVQAGEVTTRVYLEGATLPVCVQRDLVAEFTVPDGRHLYASPAPAGCVAVNMVLDEHPGVVIRNLTRPPGEPHVLANSDERFAVHHHSVELRLPITINGAVTQSDGPDSVALNGTLHWQTCDDTVCDIPASSRFSLTVPVAGIVASALRSDTDDSEPNVAQHWQHMQTRHKT